MGTVAGEVVIDAHAHIVPASLLEELAKTPVSGFGATRVEQGWVVSVPGMGDTRPIGARMTEPGPRAAWMSKTGVTRQVLSPWMDIQTGQLAPGAARDWTRRLNDAMSESAVSLGATALASVATDDGEQAATDLGELWKSPEISGLMLSTNPLGGPALHDPALTPLWTLAEEQGIPIMLHPPTCGPSGELTTIGGLGNVHGRLLDNTLAITELILHGLLDRHPGLELVLVHGGGFLPYQANRLDGGYRTKEAFVAPLARETPSAYLRDFHYDTVALSGAAIAFLAGLVGADRVLLGSDFPFALGDPEPVRTVLGSGLKPHETDAILYSNAAKLFGRKP
jgi:aminocarboxymuconate-semialdehyde decarboxylase